MVEHVVLFKLKAGATPEQTNAAVEALKGLKGQIDGIVDLTCGRNFSERSQGYEIGLVVRFRDRAALEAYIPHAAHRGVVEKYIHPIREAVIVVDYEI
jgi:stress responsive alpha/beta barrel protein